ncbi:hypothetical protein CVT26_001262 [Gymnopilus dilepis]|uniref:Uncharacterized protein n=1 Tax=Gymnopilus dilepis TaxID=231916 RepID=A0A409WEL2_9AGAR|nr:hypothetical protein CVT26_001262 [Gymnopilus dilepis]
MPRPREGSPNGPRKRRKRSHSLPIPDQLFICECSRCTENPDIHPETTEIARGRWVTEKELRTHSADETALWIGRNMVDTHLQSCRDRLGESLSDNSVPSDTVPQATLNVDIPSTPPGSPTPLGDCQSGPEEEISALMALIKPAKEVLGETLVIFKSPPTKGCLVDLDRLSTSEIDQLCDLDEGCAINSPVIGYKALLSRSRDLVDRYAGVPIYKRDHSKNDRTVLFRMQNNLLIRRVNEEEETLRSLLLDQWKYQERVAKASFAYDAGTLSDLFPCIPRPLTSTILQLVARFSSDLQMSFDLRSVPNNVRTVVGILGVKPRYDSYTEISSRNAIQTVYDVNDYFHNSSKSTIYKLAKPDLFSLYLHRVHSHPLGQISVKELKAMTNAMLVDHIQSKRKEEGIVDEKGRLLTASQPKTRVLGRVTLSEIRDLEKTMFDKFTSAQSIRAIFKPGNIPSVLEPLAMHYTKVFESDRRGTYRNDVMSHDKDFRATAETITWTDDQLSAIPRDLYTLLRQLLYERRGLSLDTSIPKTAYFRRSITRLGQTFTTKQVSSSDSRVIFVHSEDEAWSAASISSIFSHVYKKGDGSEVVRTYAVLKEYKQLSADDAVHDHYRRYAVAGGRSFQHVYTKIPLLVEFSQIKAHFAGYTYRNRGAEWILALPLDKS